MTSRNLPIGLMALGMAAMLASWLWPYFVSEDRLWNETNAQGLNEATLNLHEQLHAHGHVHEEGFGHDHEEDEHSHLEHPDAIAASQRYREAQGQLQMAQFWQSAAPVYLRWGGLMVSLVGVMVYYATRGKA